MSFFSKCCQVFTMCQRLIQLVFAESNLLLFIWSLWLRRSAVRRVKMTPSIKPPDGQSNRPFKKWRQKEKSVMKLPFWRCHFGLINPQILSIDQNDPFVFTCSILDVPIWDEQLCILPRVYIHLKGISKVGYLIENSVGRLAGWRATKSVFSVSPTDEEFNLSANSSSYPTFSL